jgi:hypothetical protein
MAQGQAQGQSQVQQSSMFNLNFLGSSKDECDTAYDNAVKNADDAKNAAIDNATKTRDAAVKAAEETKKTCKATKKPAPTEPAKSGGFFSNILGTSTPVQGQGQAPAAPPQKSLLDRLQFWKGGKKRRGSKKVSKKTSQKTSQNKKAKKSKSQKKR